MLKDKGYRKPEMKTKQKGNKMNVEIFKNSEFGEVRVVRDENNEPWFVAKDVCNILGLSDVSMTLQNLEDNEKLIQIILVSGQRRNMWTINESGLYSLILRSRKPQAKQVKIWFDEEVLPKLKNNDKTLKAPIDGSSELQIFKNNEFGEVRVMNKNNEAWFALIDVCNVLNIKNPRDVKAKQLKKDGVDSIYGVDKLNRKTTITIINEANLYRLIFMSRKEEAIRFQDWVVEDVLPSIRKYGMYMTDSLVDRVCEDPDFMIDLLQKYKKEKEEKAKLKDKVEILTHTGKLYTATEIATELGFRNARVFNKELEKLGIHRKVNKTWVLTSKYAELGYKSNKQNVSEYGFSFYDSRWTQAGREFLLNLFKKDLTK